MNDPWIVLELQNLFFYKSILQYSHWRFQRLRAPIYIDYE